VGHFFSQKTVPFADEYGEEEFMLQLVRRAPPTMSGQKEKMVAEPVTAREKVLSKSLITILSVNIFILSGVLSFCAFTFWYPS
jgi:hypothetical protein